MILEVNGVAFNYNSREVLRDVRFSVEEGELFAILGPNGVGKTTLLRCINAILRPTQGSVLIDKQDVFSLDSMEIARRFSYVAQRTETGRLTAFDSILMGRRPHIGWRVSDRDLTIVDAAIKRVGLQALAMRYIDQMSGGELQKVVIARALVQEPRLLLLDEPTSSLDLKNQIEILKLIRWVVVEHHVAGVMTMHDLNMALRYAHKYIFLNDGSIFSVGEVGDISADMVESVYGLPVEILHHKGYPLVLPLEKHQTQKTT